PAQQASLIKAALADAQIEPNSISYVEAHGTGTILGDPIEMRALCDAYELTKQHRSAGALAVGSIKSNIGHLEGAAGLAGVVKVLLQMRHKKLVPSLHTHQLNGEIDWSSLRIVQTSEPWLPRQSAGKNVWRA